MSVFSANIITPRAVPDPGTDHTLPPAGALSYAAITSASALAGTNGVDATLVQGDTWMELHGNMTVDIYGHLKSNIFQNHLHKTIGNLNCTIIGNTIDKRIGPQIHTNIAPRNDIFCHTRTECHSQPECQSQPTTRSDAGGDSFWTFKNNWNFCWFSANFAVIGLNAFLIYARAAYVYAQDNGLVFGNALAEVGSKGLKVRLGALKSEIQGAHLGVKVVKVGAIPLKALAGMSFKFNTPWS
jgi:hypothetical protein